jgi:hypothetical protein
MRASIYNGGAFCRSARGTGNNAATAGGSGDATEVSAAWVSRDSATGIANSMKVIVSYTATLAAGATLTFAGNMQDATDGSGTGAADYGDAVTATVVATGGTGGSTETGTFELDVDLAGAREFVRAQITPNLSAANTDTAAWSVTYVFFGDQRHPCTKSTVNIGSAD